MIFLNSYGTPLLFNEVAYYSKTCMYFERYPLLMLSDDLESFDIHSFPANWMGITYSSVEILDKLILDTSNKNVPLNLVSKTLPLEFDTAYNIPLPYNNDLIITMLRFNANVDNNIMYLLEDSVSIRRNLNKQEQLVREIVVMSENNLYALSKFTWYHKFTYIIDECGRTLLTYNGLSNLDIILCNDVLREAISRGVDTLYVNNKLFHGQKKSFILESLMIHNFAHIVQPKMIHGLWGENYPLPTYMLNCCAKQNYYE